MKRAVIIGGGPAGLTAAYELLDKSSDTEVTVLEESDIFGGISKTVNYNGNRMDMGGASVLLQIAGGKRLVGENTAAARLAVV